MTTVSKPIAVLAVVLALALAACGGASGRPSTGDMESALKSAKVNGKRAYTDKQAECLAPVYVKSGISDKGLNDMISGKIKNLDDVSSADQAAVKKILGQFTACTQK